MPLRFRKSFTLFPGVKVNVSKGGTSISVGKKGFHLNFGKHGVRETVGIPGTGISETNYLVKHDAKDEDKKESQKEERAEETKSRATRHPSASARERASSPWGFFLFVVIALFFIYFGGSALGLIPPNFVTNLLQTLAHLAKQARL